MNNFSISIMNGAAVLNLIGEEAQNGTEGLQLSIEKYEYTLKYLEDNPDVRYVLNGGTGTCGLCHVYWERGCIGCPVEKSTGQLHCEGTPYCQVVEAVGNAKSIQAVRAELDFLRSLQEE